VARQTGANLLLHDGRLTYDPIREKTTETVYNTMTTPRGRQFQLTLPDGTMVWLNAASSIRYPTVFTGTERQVEITGEAYFEVTKNIKMPFRVRVDDRADIEVLGTHFNVNAYENEKTLNTTLLEGSIRVLTVSGEQTSRKMTDGVILKPGQQAQLRTELHVFNNTDIDKVMAWKNGAFNFEDLPLEEAMRQLERWYDIKVKYENGVPDIRFGGKIGRDVSLADLLQILAGTKLKFRIEKGRELIIMN
jgi:ferric-dicitrate binding protein FerR (iron transport regulator)